MPRYASLAAVLFAALCSPLAAQIHRWDNGQAIAGAEHIQLGPGVDLSGWNAESRNLRYADFEGVDLTGANFSGSWLDNSYFPSSRLAQANLAGANLSNAYLGQVTLTGADLTGAVIEGAFIFPQTSHGFTMAQLASTRSYQDRELMGISLWAIDLTAWDFTGQNLSYANFRASDVADARFAGANLINAYVGVNSFANADFSFADLRGAYWRNEYSESVDLRNSILPDGVVLGLDLKAEERLIVRDDDGVADPIWMGWPGFERAPVPITVRNGFTMADDAVLELQFDADPVDSWDSSITFQPDIPVQLGGTLALTFAKDADPRLHVGRRLDLFDWTGVSAIGVFSVSSPYDWDLGRLYTTGEATLLAAEGLIAGDADGDGQVGMDDFGLIKTYFGTPGARPQGDANGDGRIDLTDFGLLKLNFGKTAAVVPEPNTVALLLVAVSCLVLRRLTGLRAASFLAVLLAIFLAVSPLWAQINRWDTGEMIPGTERITPGPGVQLDRRNLVYALLRDLDLTGANFERSELGYASLQRTRLAGANLTSAYLLYATLEGADLAGAMIAGADFFDTTSRGFTHAQFVSTQSYADQDLTGIGLGHNDLAGWSFAGQDLSNAYLGYASLTGANLTGAVIAGAEFLDTTSGGFTHAQLASTQSYRDRNLTGVGLHDNDLSGWDLAGQNLSNAKFGGATLAGADLTGAVVKGANFAGTTSRGFTHAQLAATQTFADKDLAGIGLGDNDLSGWDLAGQNLGGAFLLGSTLAGAKLTGANLSNAWVNSTTSFTGADLSFADLRGTFVRIDEASLRNSILSDGTVSGLVLKTGERLSIRDYDGRSPACPRCGRDPTSVTIADRFEMADDAVLELQFDADAVDSWDSSIAFQSDIPVQLDGTLKLTFAKAADSATHVGRRLDLFDWTGVAPTGAFTVSSLYDWDLSQLYTAGTVTLLAAGGVIAGDSNGDGKVDLGDFGTLKVHFGAAGSKAHGDANSDGKIDLSDFGLVKVNFGKSAPGNAVVPEPATLVLAIAACLALLMRRPARGLRGLLAVAAALATPCVANAQIYRWDNGQVIPGTEGITVGPGVDLSNWNSDSKNLRFADFGDNDLTDATFASSDLGNARFLGSASTLANADFTDAWVRGAALPGLAEGQLYTTASYKAKNLQGITLGSNLAGWNLSGQDLTGTNLGNRDLTGASFAGADLTDVQFVARSKGPVFPSILLDADFTGAIVQGASFWGTTARGFTAQQLYSTASYLARDLRGINLVENEMSGWSFNFQNLTNAWMGHSNLARADLRNSDLTSADLAGANLSEADLAHADLRSSNLNVADLRNANLTDTDLTDAILDGAVLYGADLRSAVLSELPLLDLRNAILPVGAESNAGEMRGLEVKTGESLILRSNYHCQRAPGCSHLRAELVLQR